MTPHHFTKNTVSATFWCKPCGKPTVHYVFDGRRGGCQECIARYEAEAVKRAAGRTVEEAEGAPPEQGNLF